MDVFVEVIGETEKSLQFESFFFSDYLLYLFSQKDSIMLHLSYGMWFYPWSCQLPDFDYTANESSYSSEINTEQQGSLVLCTWIS